MFITLEQMRKLHGIQLEMFQELKRVMEVLGIRYYFVHGSLLSAVTTQEFIEEDDDIDIAIFREDYELLLIKGNEIADSKYFIQDSRNDDYPLSFAKFRNRETTFYQPILKKCKCSKGIYIDIFPIDFVPDTEGSIAKAKRYLLQARINGRLQYKRSLKQICLLLVSMLFYPSYQHAIQKREKLYSACSEGKYVSIFGGKATEQRMLACWFGKGMQSKFCGIEVNCPTNADAYLARIYGKDYKHKNPADDRITLDRRIEVSASYIDFGEGDILDGKDTQGDGNAKF